MNNADATISADTTVPMPNELISRPSVKKR